MNTQHILNSRRQPKRFGAGSAVGNNNNSSVGGGGPPGATNVVNTANATNNSIVAGVSNTIATAGVSGSGQIAMGNKLQGSSKQ